jgi:hypothetical protein
MGDLMAEPKNRGKRKTIRGRRFEMVGPDKWAVEGGWLILHRLGPTGVRAWMWVLPGITFGRTPHRTMDDAAGEGLKALAEFEYPVLTVEVMLFQ